MNKLLEKILVIILTSREIIAAVLFSLLFLFSYIIIGISLLNIIIFIAIIISSVLISKRISHK